MSEIGSDRCAADRLPDRMDAREHAQRLLTRLLVLLVRRTEFDLENSGFIHGRVEARF